MEVIITKPTKKFKAGEVVSVKKGYARNFLLPNGYALRATQDNKQKIEELKQDLEVKHQELRTNATAALNVIEGKALTFISQALEDGKLFGSISAKQIARHLNDGYNLNLRSEQINIQGAIKSIGIYKVEVILHHDVVANIIVNIARTDSEAATQYSNFKAEEAAKMAHLAPVAEVEAVPAQA